DGAAGEWYARLAQHSQHIIVDRLQLLFAHRRRIHLQQQMRAALQVEPEHDVTLRPARPMTDHVLRKEIGQGEKPYGERKEQNGRCLPAREKQHGSGFPYSTALQSARPCPLCAPNQAALSSLTGSPFARTSLSMARTCRTFTPSAISISI